MSEGMELGALGRNCKLHDQNDPNDLNDHNHPNDLNDLNDHNHPNHEYCKFEH